MKTYKYIILLCGLTSSLALAQVYPLSENTWSNPDFVKRFMGSYGVDTAMAPSVTSEEGLIFKQVSEAAKTSSASAITILQNNITPESSGAMDYALANFLLQEKRMAEAMRSYQEAIRKFPNFNRAYRNLGLAYIQQNDYANALTYLTKSLEIGGGDGGLFGLVGYCHLNTDNPGSALDAYRFALVFEPNVRDWRLGQLKSLQKLRRYNEVESIIYRYIEEDPNESEFWLQQANAFVSQKKYPEAVANLEIVDALGGSDLQSLLLMGDLYMNLEAPMQALVAYKKALKGGEVSEKKAIQLAQMISRQVEPVVLDEFVTKVEEALGKDIAPQNELTLLTLRAGSALAQDKKAKAMEILTTVVGKDPLNGNALLTLGAYHLGEEDYPTALDFYGRAEKVEKVKFDALLGSARVLVKSGDYYAAISRLKEAQLISDQPFVSQYINTLEKYVN